ncbi:hypothetical protein N7481_001666 [Penicillium waksmanii]|uniref:uncharacterized protein n=1 Tax=Penicillium waksmanii TaxID=69791 RepID=UPI0025477D14|nr:uncharacterized protein N7481_001666 [Penicillium waksmanii]KAJ5994689.1 hypothetical protein N7481_001666 [Penicillium waksmanii]
MPLAILSGVYLLISPKGDVKSALSTAMIFSTSFPPKKQPASWGPRSSHFFTSKQELDLKTTLFAGNSKTQIIASKTFVIIAGVGPETGASIARKFAKAYSVVLLAHNPDSYKTIVEEINSGGGQAVGISTDLTDSNSLKYALNQMATQYLGYALAAVFFNSGGGLTWKPFIDLMEEGHRCMRLSTYPSISSEMHYVCTLEVEPARPVYRSGETYSCIFSDWHAGEPLSY